MDKTFVPIESREYWVKIVEMLQQNWALVEGTDNGSTIFFIHDHAGLYASDDGSQIFDRIECSSKDDAERQLRQNGFRLFSENPNLHSMLKPPPPPFFKGTHPNGEIYSSGRHWQS